jgi:hypothetical protein
MWARKRDMMNDYDGLVQINLGNYLLKYYFSGNQNFHQKTQSILLDLIVYVLNILTVLI